LFGKHKVRPTGDYVKVSSLDNLKENDFYLNIPLYVEKIIADNLPGVEEALADLKNRRRHFAISHLISTLQR
jgi:type I restriction enzyme M protein